MTQTDDPVDAGVGSVAEEAAKLLGALSGWARDSGDGLYDGVQDGLSSLADELHEHVSTGSPECSWCPLCRTVAAVRHASPEVKAHLSTAASSLMLAVSGLLATRPPPRDPGDPEGEPHGDGATRVERIRLDDPPAADGAEADNVDADAGWDTGWDAGAEDADS
jgi:hypothetical protein